MSFVITLIHVLQFQDHALIIIKSEYKMYHKWDYCT